MAGKAAMAGQCYPNMACCASSLSYVSWLEGGEADILLGTWHLVGELTRPEAVLTSIGCLLPWFMEGLISSRPPSLPQSPTWDWRDATEIDKVTRISIKASRSVVGCASSTSSSLDSDMSSSSPKRQPTTASWKGTAYSLPHIFLFLLSLTGIPRFNLGASSTISLD